MQISEPPEVLFLKYAFPCSFIILQRGEITQKEFDMLEDAAENNKIVSRKILERVYHKAFEKIKPIAKEMNKDYWDIEVIKEYFLVRHNKLIDQGMFDYERAPETLKKLCKIHKAKVIDVKDDVLVVEYSDGNKKSKRPVMNHFVKEAKVGDEVMIHYGYWIEVVAD